MLKRATGNISVLRLFKSSNPTSCANCLFQSCPQPSRKIFNKYNFFLPIVKRLIISFILVKLKKKPLYLSHPKLGDSLYSYLLLVFCIFLTQNLILKIVIIFLLFMYDSSRKPCGTSPLLMRL